MKVIQTWVFRRCTLPSLFSLNVGTMEYARTVLKKVNLAHRELQPFRLGELLVQAARSRLYRLHAVNKRPGKR